MKILSLSFLRWSLAGLAAAFCAPTLRAGQFMDTLAIFNGANGAFPASLVQTPEGDFYGVTTRGGKYDKGTLFKIPLYKEMVTLVDFNGANGADPAARLLQTDDQTFYGTTREGGTEGKGTVFQLTAGGNFKTLVSFHGSDGAQPDADLVGLPDGTIYGSTTAGGEHNLGTIFSLSPGGAVKVLASFDGADGAHPHGLTLGQDGTIYGVTSEGGSDNRGAIFKVSPDGTLTLLHSFPGPGPVNLGAHLEMLNGVLYGTTALGGEYHLGSIFTMTPDGTVSDVTSFDGRVGERPGPDLVRWQNGYFYMDRMYRNKSAKANWTQWRETNFCGIAKSGGVHGDGTLYLIGSNGTVMALASFTGTGGLAQGADPDSLVVGIDGNLYGTTLTGGQNDKGTVFRLQVQIVTPVSPGGGYVMNPQLPPIVTH